MCWYSVPMNSIQASAVLKVLGERVKKIDETECNVEDERNSMRAERANLVAVMGEITLAEMP